MSGTVPYADMSRGAGATSQTTPGQAGGKPQSKTPNETLIEHVARLWAAECENATRIANRSQLFAGGILALLGLGLFGFEWTYEMDSVRVCHPNVTIFIHILLVGVVVCFTWALGHFYLGADNASTTAAESMEITQADVDRGQPVRHIVFNKVYNAYFNLKARNRRQRIRLKKGKDRFTVGVALTLLAVLVYLGGSLPTKIDVEAIDEYYAKQKAAAGKSDASVGSGEHHQGSTRPSTGQPRRGRADAN